MATIEDRQRVETNYQVVNHLTDEQIQQLCELYETTWWAKGRPFEVVQRMVNHSDVIVGICDRQTSGLIGFARVLTDYTYRALLLDVIVHETYRDRGLGRLILNSVFHHPDLQSVEAWLLVCREDVVPFYEKWGFTTDFKDVCLMARSGVPSSQEPNT
ncbi:MAG TPA: GNAT family N-acetyltransferase [Leptolyngbyaceae cyanobacterium M33_DOE_097]|uniref:N-acetyltransferase n=1 Tax=Oscillatoriales cyanobacterium SpSt-418 TaxID=2282169 RepID=A0A7C3KHB7_9CYAN|nr:GNAT family N-acetyltransferase [Leptolyngbyaceae cyanobacterium M33_DOE_097]